MKKKPTHLEFLKKEKVDYLSRLRIIKKNLIHIDDIPEGIARVDLLESEPYLGQYGKITKIIIIYKVNQENNQEKYSAYITFSNEFEAALTILCLDSLLVEGRAIRTFFGITKYCDYFLNKKICPNLDKCSFLHQFTNDNNIIIDSNNSFSYQDHLNLAKKIFDVSNLKAKYLSEKNNTIKVKKNIFPPIDFLFLNEEEKEKYFTSSNIKYIKTRNTKLNDVLFKNFDVPRNNLMFKNNSFNNTQKEMFLGLNDYEIESNFNHINNKGKSEYSMTENLFEKQSDDSLSSGELHNIFINTIHHILITKPLYMSLKNVNIEKLELEYFLKDLTKNNIDMYEILDGCLDPINHLL